MPNGCYLFEGGSDERVNGMRQRSGIGLLETEIRGGAVRGGYKRTHTANTDNFSALGVHGNSANEVE